MSKNARWVLGLTLAALLLLGIYFLIRQSGSGTIAVISQDGEELYRIDLSKVTEPYDLVISGEYGSNRVHVEKNSIAVTEADCPDKVCVRSGPITTSGIPIVCMPHRLVIAIEGGDIDAF